MQKNKRRPDEMEKRWDWNNNWSNSIDNDEEISLLANLKYYKHNQLEWLMDWLDEEKKKKREKQNIEI